MRFKNLLTILLLFVATLLWAEPITQSTARKKAVIFASKHGKTIAEDVKNLFKVRGKTKAQAMPYYVFNTNDDNGFVIVSGDDRTAEILAYSDKGRFNADEIPDNMRAWLRYYAHVIGTLESTSSVKASSTTLYDNGLREANSAISPLLSCTWNQGSPYYDRCPLVEGRRCYTGCVCTAAVQVMYYHQWPKSATTNISEHSFTYNNRRYTENELTPVVFDWKSMNDSYRDGQSDHSATAVAVLMQYVGQAIKSGYGPDGTGSSFTEVENALKNNFGYDGNIQHLFRNNYSNEAWESLIYRELAERRPVLYAGTSSGGAHAFVCDGYDGNGLFHINWGWGGMCNGYFKLSVLNPNDNSGMGASSSKDGYSMNQDVLIGIQPPSKHADNPVATFYSDIDYNGKAVDLPEGEFLLSSLQSYGITNDDISSLKVKSGFKVVVYENDGFGGKSKSYTASTANMGSEWNKQVSSIKIEPNGKSGLSGNFKIMNRNSGKYLDLDNNKTDNNTAIVQFDDEGVDASQTWTFTEVMKGKGVYSICSYGNKNRGMDVVDFSKENGAQVQLYDYLGNNHQQFILYDCGEGYYQLVARNSGKVVEIPQSSKGNGEWIKIYDNNGTHTQQWAVVENRYDEASAVTLYTDKDYKGKAVTLSEGEYNLSRMGLYNLKDNDMSSLKVTPGFKVTIYEGDNFNGKSKSYIASESFVGAEWNDKMSSLTVEAYHELQVTYQIGDAQAITSEVGTEGSLATLLGDNAMKVTQLSVNGYLKREDIILLQQMAGNTEGKGSLKSLDLSKATFTETGKVVPHEIFLNCKNLQKVDLSGMTEIEFRAFKNCALTEISIPASVTKIEESAFAGNSAVTKVIVHSGSQIDARSYDGENNIFSGMDPNKVQVVFEGAAEYNYKNYRNDIQVGNNGYKNAFMDLLTKTLDENDDDYTVVAQRHADVRLKRTFKPGWNTLVLPFGARYLEGDSEAHDCSRIFQKALNASNTEGFMIAAYRGLAKNEAQPDNSTFYFLKYANYDKDPLDEFEPLLIRMTQKDIDNAKGVYTFKNVELNYDGDFDDGKGGKYYKEYTAKEAKERMGTRHTGEYFDGSYDTNANDKFTKCSYDDFYFTGTLYKQDTDKTPAFIAPGDYIIQNNTFVKCLSGKKYGLKGFRGYFKQKPSGSSAKGNIGICLVDRNGVVSSIHQVDGASLMSASVAPVAVYNLSGQQVGNSLSTLAKGVYIVKGKKFVKK